MQFQEQRSRLKKLQLSKSADINECTTDKSSALWREHTLHAAKTSHSFTCAKHSTDSPGSVDDHVHGFGPEDGDKMFPRNGGTYLRDCTAPRPKTTSATWIKILCPKACCRPLAFLMPQRFLTSIRHFVCPISVLAVVVPLYPICRRRQILVTWQSSEFVYSLQFVNKEHIFCRC
jgi:hypothetical protein